MKNIEYERTYLVKTLPVDLEEAPSKILVDVYFPRSAAHPTLRLRQKGDKYELTKKNKPDPNDASTQIETTVDLTREEFESMAKGDGKVVRKRRYYYDYKGQIAEIDVFEGELKGLVLVDFEFKSREELLEFEKPDFCLVDVTQEEPLAGGMLAGKSLENIQQELNKFNYESLAMP